LKNRQDIIAAQFGNNYRYCVEGAKKLDPNEVRSEAEKQEDERTKNELLLFALMN